jgi:serine phosphatase RsbU (regulator of sigma subunit)
VNGQLASGDVLVLYTDGIIEAINQDDEMFDYRRFVELLKKSFDKDLESFWQKIIAGNRQWAVRQDDDLTFMLIRYE